MPLAAFPPLVAAYLLLVMALFGLVMGSALHCLAWRIAHNEPWAGGRSHCPACGHTLSPRELVPLFSWLVQKGRCRSCGAAIPARYPLSEAALAVVYVSLLVCFGISGMLVQSLVLCSCLFCLSLVDLDVQLIPHRFLLIPAVVRLIGVALESGFVRAGLWLLQGVAIGTVVLGLVLVLDKVLGKPSMGGGDIKLLAVLGLYFSPLCWLLMLIIACVLGIVLGLSLGAKKGVAFPFGPAISAAAWLALLVGEPLCSWYIGLF